MRQAAKLQLAVLSRSAVQQLGKAPFMQVTAKAEVQAVIPLMFYLPLMPKI